jgi:hypothetical protein
MEGELMVGEDLAKGGASLVSATTFSDGGDGTG